MRLFFAFALDEPVRAAAARVEEDLHQRLVRAGSPRAVKWVERENLHVTLRFLGEVDDTRWRVLADALNEPLGCAPFELAVGGAGSFPSSGPPRVVWIGVSEGTDHARGVFAALESRISPLAFEREERDYTPHLTLGRVREIDWTHGRQLRDWLGEVPREIGAERVGTITLYQSRLSLKGPRYEIVKEIPLS